MLCAAVLPLSLPSAAQAIEIYQTRGKTAVVEFYSFDPATCISTSGYIFATESRTRVAPGSPTSLATATVNFFQSNECTWEALTCVIGSVPLEEGDFQVIGNLGSATLNATVEGYDCLTGNTGTVGVAINWTGEGDMNQGHSQSSYSYQGFRSRYSFNGQSRAATVNGTFTYGGTTAALENTYGYLSVASGGTFYKYN
jgi:hypothetical protein